MLWGTLLDNSGQRIDSEVQAEPIVDDAAELSVGLVGERAHVAIDWSEYDRLVIGPAAVRSTDTPKKSPVEAGLILVTVVSDQPALRLRRITLRATRPVANMASDAGSGTGCC